MPYRLQEFAISVEIVTELIVKECVAKVEQRVFVTILWKYQLCEVKRNDY